MRYAVQNSPNYTKRFVFSPILSVVLLLQFASFVHGEPTYRLTSLDFFEFAAESINDLGQVSGRVDRQASFWSAEHGVVKIGTFPGGSWGSAAAINTNGEAAGSSGGSEGGFYWTAFTGMQAVGTLDGRWSEGHDINDHGQVVGYSGFNNQSNEMRAFLWDKQTGIQNLGAFDGHKLSKAEAINNKGEIAGYSSTNSWPFVTQAFIWDNENSIHLLNGINSDNSKAFDINDHTQVVGIVDNRAFIWESANCHTLIDNIGGFSHNYAFAINNIGQVVGKSGDEYGTNAIAYLWDNENKTQNLNDLVDGSAAGWHLFEANDINIHGQIIGRGINPDGETVNFLLTPIPEPTTFIIMAVASSVVVIRQR